MRPCVIAYSSRICDSSLPSRSPGLCSEFGFLVPSIAFYPLSSITARVSHKLLFYFTMDPEWFQLKAASEQKFFRFSHYNLLRQETTGMPWNPFSNKTLRLWNRHLFKIICYECTQKSLKHSSFKDFISLEPVVRIELTTRSLRMNCSTSEPHRQDMDFPSNGICLKAGGGLPHPDFRFCTLPW